MKIIPSLGMLALSAFPTFAQDSQPPATATPLPTPPAAASLALTAQTDAINSNTSQVLKLVKSGVGDEVILAYVKNSRAYYNLGADDVLKLKDAGVSSPVISAMLAHDTTLRGQATPKRAEVAATPTPAPAPATVPIPTPSPAPSLVEAPAPAPTATMVAAPPPPPPQIEYVPVAPGPDYYWSDGHWSWRGGAWVWIGGSWSLRPSVRLYIGAGPRYHWRHW